MITQNSCGIIPLEDIEQMNCQYLDFEIAKHSFKDGKYYRNDEYYGDIVEDDGITIKVKLVTDNCYLNGKEVEFVIVN